MNPNLTLEQGLAKFAAKNSKFFAKKAMSPEGAAFLQCHDVTHVVFGCGTTIYGEGVVKIWTTFGTTLPFWQVVRGYNDASAFELARMYSFGHVVKNIFSLLIAIPSVIIRAKHMAKPWPFTEYEAYLQVPLSEIREEFGIEVL